MLKLRCCINVEIWLHNVVTNIQPYFNVDTTFCACRVAYTLMESPDTYRVESPDTYHVCAKDARSNIIRYRFTDIEQLPIHGL